MYPSIQALYHGIHSKYFLGGSPSSRIPSTESLARPAPSLFSAQERPHGPMGWHGLPAEALLLEMGEGGGSGHPRRLDTSVEDVKSTKAPNREPFLNPCKPDG